MRQWLAPILLMLAAACFVLFSILMVAVLMAKSAKAGEPGPRNPIPVERPADSEFGESFKRGKFEDATRRPGQPAPGSEPLRRPNLDK